MPHIRIHAHTICMSIYISICTVVVYMHRNVCMHIAMYGLCVYGHMCACADVNLCIQVCISQDLWVPVCLHKYPYMYTCVCACIHVYHICFTMLSNMSIHPHVCMSMSSSARTRGAQGFVLYVICTSHMYDFVCLQVSLQSRPHASNHAYREHGRICMYIYISADPGRRQGGAHQGREVVDNKKCNNGFWEVFQSSRTATPARSNSSKI